MFVYQNQALNGFKHLEKCSISALEKEINSLENFAAEQPDSWLAREKLNHFNNLLVLKEEYDNMHKLYKKGKFSEQDFRRFKEQVVRNFEPALKAFCMYIHLKKFSKN